MNIETEQDYYRQLHELMELKTVAPFSIRKIIQTGNLDMLDGGTGFLTLHMHIEYMSKDKFAVKLTISNLQGESLSAYWFGTKITCEATFTRVSTFFKHMIVFPVIEEINRQLPIGMELEYDHS